LIGENFGRELLCDLCDFFAPSVVKMAVLNREEREVPAKVAKAFKLIAES